MEHHNCMTHREELASLKHRIVGARASLFKLVDSGSNQAKMRSFGALSVVPYGYTLAEFTDKISNLRNKLGNQGIKDEDLIVNTTQVPEGKSVGNVLAGDQDSVAFDRTLLRIVYGSGEEAQPGGFYPNGADHGEIAKSYLKF